MRRDAEIEKLIGGYATGSLTGEERRRLFEAALDDQELFDALQEEQPLKELFDDPVSREMVRKAALGAAVGDGKPARAPWFRRPWIWAAASSLALASVTTIVMLRLNHPTPEKPLVHSIAKLTEPEKAVEPTPRGPVAEPRKPGATEEKQQLTRPKTGGIQRRERLAPVAPAPPPALAPAMENYEKKESAGRVAERRSVDSPSSRDSLALDKKAEDRKEPAPNQTESKDAGSNAPRAPSSSQQSPNSQQQLAPNNQQQVAINQQQPNNFSQQTPQTPGQRSRQVVEVQGAAPIAAPIPARPAPVQPETVTVESRAAKGLAKKSAERGASGRAGFQTHALPPLHYSITLRMDDGSYRPVSSDAVFDVGDHIRLAIGSQASGAISIMQRDQDHPDWTLFRTVQSSGNDVIHVDVVVVRDQQLRLVEGSATLELRIRSR